MAERHIYRHEDGREVSLTDAGFKAHYGPSSGFKKVREEEPTDFVVTGVPKPKRKRNRPRPKEAAPLVEPETDAGEA